MGFVPVPNVAHLAFIGEADGQETVNDLYFVSTAPPITALSLQTLADTLSAWYNTNIVTQLPSDYIFSHVRARDLTSVNSFIATSIEGAQTGGLDSESAPNNVSANVTFSSGLAGRSNHGSNRIPPIANLYIDINEIDPGYLATILDGYDLLLAPSLTLPGGWTWVIVSRFTGTEIIDGEKVPIPRTEGIFNEVFSVFFTDNIVDSQKTRLPKHGK